MFQGEADESVSGCQSRKIGDQVVIMSFVQVDVKEAKDWKPKVVVLSEKNSQVIRADNVLIAENLNF